MRRPLTLLVLTLAALVGAARAAHTQSALPPTAAPGQRTWSGKWIWTSGDPAPRNSYTYFRKTLDLGSADHESKLHITADSKYLLFVNGQFAGRGPVRSDRRWQYYDTWDVGSKLKKGKNVLAVLVHHIGESTFSYMEGRGGLIADLVTPSGKTFAQTDHAWRALRSKAWASAGPRIDIQIEFNETYDAREEPQGWKTAQFNDASWEAAAEIGAAGMEPWPHLIARDIPPMREMEVGPASVLEVKEAVAPDKMPPFVSKLMATETHQRLERASVKDPDGVLAVVQPPAPKPDPNEPKPVEEPVEEHAGARVRTAPGADVSFLIDFGKEVTGYPHFHVKGAAGGEIIDMGYGEVLQDEKGGFIPPASGKLGRLNPDRDGVHYADRCTLRAGEQVYQTFEKRGFRYLQLDVRNAPAGLELRDVGILFSTYPVEKRGAFSCSDERLNKIWETGRYTCQLNMEDAYTDCPWRERGQWWGDARVEGLINYYCFGDRALIKKALRQHGQSLNAEGMTWGVYPTDWDGGRLPSFTLIWVATLWDYYQHTGDKALVEELYPKVRYTLDTFFGPRVSDKGLLKDVPYWVFIDWAPVETDGQGGALNAYYYDALRCAAMMGRLTGSNTAAEYEKRADAVKTALNRELWDPQAHAYRDSIQKDGKLSPKISQQTNSLCVLYDIAPAAEQSRVLDYIYNPANKGKVVEAGSPYFSYYQLAALYHAGRHEQALAYIRERWGRMLDWGATTWWEMWQPGASFCHGWSGGPTYNLPSEVLGIKPLKPGFAEIAVAPQWVGLTYATGIVPLTKGEVRVGWQRDPATKSAAVRVEVPKDVPVEITLPTTGEIKVNKKSSLPKGITRLDSPAGTPRLRVEKGGTTLIELRER